MNITFAPRGILEINDARIIYRNFAGESSKYNREGDRNFSIAIPDRDITNDEAKGVLSLYSEAIMIEDGNGNPILVFDGTPVITISELLQAMGWNIRVRPPRNEDEDPFMHLPVKVKFNDRGPSVYLVSGYARRKLNEDTVSCLDKIDISKVDIDIRPYDYDVNGKTGRAAYLQGIAVYQEIDRFASRFEDEDEE